MAEEQTRGEVFEKLYDLLEDIRTYEIAMRSRKFDRHIDATYRARLQSARDAIQLGWVLLLSKEEDRIIEGVQPHFDSAQRHFEKAKKATRGG